ncbi:hypothetical protein [Sphingorhabdus sp.]|jgi:hypothetical protein|uniref:hypothetical protein n=1 Tax=Sphingorhabdus sp. TaxID=1902408 RepID=UPI0037CA5198
MMPHNQRRGQNARCGRSQRRKLALIDPSVSDAQFGKPGNTDSTIKRAENNFLETSMMLIFGDAWPEAVQFLRRFRPSSQTA